MKFHLPMRKTRKWSGPSRRLLASAAGSAGAKGPGGGGGGGGAPLLGRPNRRAARGTYALRSTQRAQFDMLDNERVLLIFLVLLLENEGGSPLRTGDAGGGGGGGAHHLERRIQVRTQQRMFDL